MCTRPRTAGVVSRVLALSALIAILSVIGCGGGGTSSNNNTPVTYTVGGTVSGLAGSGLVLEDNGGNNLTVSANGSFTFTTALASGTTYSVTVLSQPSNPTQTCVVTSGSGTLSSSNVTNVSVACTTNTYTVGGTVSGLAGSGLVLQDNGGNNLTVSANGPFTFTTALASGTTYSATVLSQPSNPTQTCSITSGSGTVTNAPINAVAVTCVTPSFTALTATMTSARYDHTTTLLPNGLVLITGGFNGSFTGLKTAELYNPTTQTFTALTATMTSARYGHMATLLPNGLVLITGGLSGSTVFNTAELYNPTTQTFTALTATMTSPRAGHTATLLPNGQVLFTGGSSVFAAGPVNTAEQYDPVANTFTALTATMTTARAAHTATLLPNGLVLLTGGNSSNANLNTAELYNPTAETFTALTATMTTARDGHTATLLPNGLVLITGGYINGPVTGPAHNTTELYDPTANTFTALTATMTTDRANHTATLLPNGLVLLAGGTNGSGTPGDEPALNTAEVYEALPPSVQTFTALTATMTTARGGHTATLLPNGKVLLTGGFNGSDTVLNTAQLYDRTANTFTALTATMTIARCYHTATLLPTGQVLITGGSTNANGSANLDTAELYDPTANIFTALTATMTSSRVSHTATLLPTGRVLLTGGFNGSDTALNTAELYDPTAETFTALTATMTSARGGHTATLLPNGKVLLTGGFNGSDTNLNTAELYDPVAETFTALTATMTSARDQHTATLLPNGLVLVTGGSTSAHDSPALNTAELYDPVAETFTALTATMTSAREFHTATMLPNGLVLVTGGSANPFPTVLNTAEVYDP